MSSNVPDKWEEKAGVAYREFFKPPRSLPHPGIVGLVREMEKAIGREMAHEIVERTATRMTVEGIRRVVEEEPVNSFSDFLVGRRNRAPSHSTGPRRRPSRRRETGGSST